MLKSDIGIVYTTFLRPELANLTIKSIENNWHPDFKLFIGAQVERSSEPQLSQAIIPMPTYPLPAALAFFPFDSGVSLVRNALIERMAGERIRYCLVTADSIAFTQHTVARLDAAIAFLEARPDVGILGFDLENRIAWEWFMELVLGRFLLSRTGELFKDIYSGLLVKRCDICRQFFLARTEAILAVRWDEAFKTGDHEDFFWRFKSSGYKVYWTPDIRGQYILSRSPEYERYRMRQYTEFKKILFKKYNLTDWVEYAR